MIEDLEKLAEIYTRKGDINKVNELLIKSLKIKEKLFGINHSSVNINLFSKFEIHINYKIFSTVLIDLRKYTWYADKFMEK